MACREFDFRGREPPPDGIRFDGIRTRRGLARSLPRSFGRTCARASTTKTQSLSALRLRAAAALPNSARGAPRGATVAGLAAVLIHDGLHEVVEEVRAAARAGAWPAAQGEAKGPSALSTASWKWSFDISVATVVKTAWRHCQARYDRMAAAGASSSPTTTAWAAPHGDRSSIVTGAQVAAGGAGLVEGRVDGAPEGRDVPRSRQNGCPRRSLPSPSSCRRPRSRRSNPTSARGARGGTRRRPLPPKSRARSTRCQPTPRRRRRRRAPPRRIARVVSREARHPA